MSQDVSVREFIEEYLIGHIGKIKEGYPYFAFLLMAVGIEFLGKCLNEFEDWDDYKFTKPSDNFDEGLKVPSLNKYQNKNLYYELRCGLAHSFLTNNGLKLSDKDGVVNCEEFYKDFESACREVLAMKNLPKKNLDSPFFTIANKVNADGSIVSTTGHTSTNR